MTLVAHTRLLRGLAAAALALAASVSAHASDPVLGASRYAQDCARCHGSSPLTSNISKIYFGRNSASVIDSGISNVGDMQSLRSAYPAGSSKIADIAAYLGNAPTTLNFPSTTVGATSASQTVTVSASLKSGHSITNLVITTTGDYLRTGGTCGTTVNTGTSCTVLVAFKPIASGARAGKLNIAHSQLPTPAGIVLNGSGVAVPAPIASVSPTSLAFVTTATGTTSAAKTVTLRNTGNKTLNLTAITSSSTEFKVAGGTCKAGGTVLAGASCTVSMSFAPTIVGARSGTLSITHNAVGSPSKVTMTGTSTAAPAATLTPASVAYANQVLFTTSPSKVFTLKNTGTAGLKIGAMAVTPTDFLISTVSGATCVVGLTIAPAASCTITVRFKPLTAGLKTGTLTVTHNAPVTTSKASLSGTGVVALLAVPVASSASAPVVSAPAGGSTNTGPEITLNHPALDFLRQLTGSSGATQTVTVTNSGSAALTFSDFNMNGSAAADFIRTGSCSTAELLPAGASCTVVLGFQPAGAGERSATLNIESDAVNGNAALSLKGEGADRAIPAVTLSPAALDFGRQSLGVPSAERSLTLTNSGTAPLSLAGISAAKPFAASARCPASLAPGASCTVKVVYTPTVAGDAAGLLVIASNAGAAPTKLALQGSGAPRLPVLEWMAAPESHVEFGEVAAGSAAPATTLWLNNKGPGAVTLDQFNVSGDHADEFELAEGGSCAAGTRLAQGASCSVKVGFQPAAAGLRSATLEVASSGTNPGEVALAGQGNAVARAALRVTPAALSLRAAEPQTVTLHNEGNAVLNVARIAIAHGGFAIDDATADTAGDSCQDTPLALMPGQSCTVQLRWADAEAVAPAAGTTANAMGTLEVASDAGAVPVSVALSAGRATDTGLPAVAPGATDAAAATGGCSIARGDSAADPVLWLLVLAALAVLWVRRRRS